MSLLDRAVASPADHLPLDDAALRRLERLYRRIEPDPLFRRRLRGEVMNQFVAEREGYVRRPRTRREMGQLGRAVLYASLGVAMSVSAAGAAADRSLPGDLLYAVKLELEQIRMRIAPPSVRDDLAAMALAERVDELERLVDAGAWRLVPAAAARVTDAEATLYELDPMDGGAAATEALDVLEHVLADAPPQAHAGLAQAVEAVGGHAPANPSTHRVKGIRPDPQRPEAPVVRPTSAPDDRSATGAGEPTDEGQPLRRPPHSGNR